jgi:DNA-binding HxlR family transcriptional regulator
MVALYDGPLHYNEILSTVRSYRVVEGWTDKHSTLHDGVLANTLRKMTAEGLLIRSEESGTFPPGVSYSLNPEAARVLTASQPVVQWLRDHPSFVVRAQGYRHANNGGAGTNGVHASGGDAGDDAGLGDDAVRPGAADGPVDPRTDTRD